MNCGEYSDARIFDVAKGVLIAKLGCSLDEALAELVRVAERHHVGVLALARALVYLASPALQHDRDDDAAQAAIAEFGELFSAHRHRVAGP
ncbi:hypothetical protein A5646_19835 [Mycobacterium sp. 1245499.0]|uniref:ANTAR domain-containing protein n=1 Tax=unclassified Mycobacterium TaxID=2642494 RepID=UPI0008021B07|nr:MULTISPECIES: ANTAR domain-containing protein [unclassified Mycobacterium]OBI99882.1 hypothetical protein A5624_09355 [Mycobacterium sp. 1482292.6]OBJ21920.1 hypothetical protein A5622_16715 [Mycobacterium sp. 1245801.1]OBK04746.1 hypothetical protein A9W96_14860 [Mycobacterium sp. 1245852.3]OBL01438.1 hypothetical protein A5646_19835 [Mycobacterium sp. 1245499.0]